MAPSATSTSEQQTETHPVLKLKNNPSSTPIAQRAEAPEVQSLGRAKDGRMLNIRTYPRFNTLEEERLYRKQHLAAAFRVFADRGFDEGIAGHISVRDPILTDHFCK